MKKNRNFYLIFLLILIIGLLCFFLFVKKDKQGSDFKIAILANDGVSLVSISKERKMINVLKIDPEAKLWIPGGLGWYRNVVIKKILEQEKKTDIFSEVVFYNFGYKANKIIFVNNVDDWKSIYWWKLIFNNNFLIKDELVKDDIDLSDDFLDEIMVRDFAETKVIDEDLKLSVVNTSEINGLANFMTKRFERLGFSVVSLRNDNSENKKNCQVLYGKEVPGTYSLFLINEIIGCPIEEDSGLNGNEVEIYFDDYFSEMIHYPSYKK